MPFETGPECRKKIAIIGAGISGMGAAYRLAGSHDVTLFEAEPRLGGHARTIMAGKSGDQPVDTGFIVFNYANYPQLVRLFEDLDVPVVQSDMSFGASINGGALEYGLANLGAVFAQKRNMARPKFIGMVRDILKFNSGALAAAQDEGQSIRQLLETMQLGDWFRDYYLLPLSGAIWSTPSEKILDFPARAMIQFFENHALLHHSGQHQWYTVQGGSASYVSRLETRLRRLGVDIRCQTPVAAVRRDGLGVELRVTSAEWERFDEVVFATHSDQALRLLSDASVREHKALAAVRYQPNDIVLHSDASVMPNRRAVWSSWNYTQTSARRDGQIDLTYWMNRLQPIPMDDPHFVTLNSRRRIREELIYDQVTLHHPVYDKDALGAQKDIRDWNGTNRTWFCGAWLGHGFHEDGLASGLAVAEALEARTVYGLAAQ